LEVLDLSIGSGVGLGTAGLGSTLAGAGLDAGLGAGAYSPLYADALTGESLASQVPGISSPVAPNVASAAAPSSGGLMDLLGPIGKYIQNNPMKSAGLGLGASTLYSMLSGKGNNYLTPYTPPTAQQYGLGRTLSQNYQPFRPAMYGQGGNVTTLNTQPGSVASGGVAPADLMNTQTNQPLTMGSLQGLAEKYGVSLPTYSNGGITELAVGGKLLQGNGDGVSDSIRANIDGRQEARLASGEFVIPARVVSELGNGSTDAGARELRKMMDRVQASRGRTVGKDKVAVDSKARKYLPA
jgi:hypothetical protein